MSESSTFRWDDLRVILSIARRGTLAGAARELGVNHSTVFRRLNAFEDGLGLRVFERLPEGYVSTAAGEELLRHAERADDAMLAVELALAGRDFRLAGRVRITAPLHFATDYLAPQLPRFRERYPDVVLEIVAADRDLDLARREADIALRATAMPPEYAVGRRIASLHWWAMASPDYLASAPPLRSLSDLSNHRIIGADAAFLRLAAMARLESLVPMDRIVARAGDLETMAAMARAGVGVAWLPNDQYQPALRPLFPIPDLPDGALWLLTLPELKQLPRIRAVSDFLVEALRADPRLAAGWVDVMPGGDAAGS
ncbi:MAG: LysR family transcriptional regulator [Lysobacteraceae bacterium]